MSRWAGATWGDVTADGRIVALVGSELHVRGLDGQTGVVAYVPEPLGWLRAEVTFRGALAVVGQGQSGDGWLWRLGSWGNLGQTFGVSPLEIVADGQGWRVWMQTAADRYNLLTVALDGVTSWTQYAMPPTSQGFLDATDPELLFTDQARVVGGLMVPNLAGRYLVGQDPEVERLLLGDVNGRPLRVLDASGPCWEPRAAWVDGRVVAYSRSDAGGGIVAVGRPEDFPVWQPAPVEPEPPIGDNMLEDIQRARARYGATATDDQCVEICNEVAWVHRNEGYGISRKETGTRGVRYDGQQACHDVIMMKDGRYWDILEAAGGVSRPIWQDQPNGVITDPMRGWVAPIVPQGAVEPPVPPDPPPASDLEGRLAALEQWRVDVGRYVVRTATEWPR